MVGPCGCARRCARPRTGRAGAAVAALARPDAAAAAKAEGTLVVYSSTNEQEGLPLFKMFTEATGIKVDYVRASDAVLMSRMAIEFRAEQKSWDILHTGTINKMPPQMLAQIEPPEAQAHLRRRRAIPDRRWYGVYANYNAPAYNTKKVKASELPKSYEEFAAAQGVGRQGRHRRHRQRMAQGDVRSTTASRRARRSSRTSSATLKPVVTDGHLALARATGAGEYWMSLNNYVNLSMNVKLAGGPIEVWALDPVALFFGQVGVNAQGAESERGAARRQFHAQPGMRSSSSPSSAACRPAAT